MDPRSGGTAARVLLLRETPSVTAAYASGIVSLDEDDATAADLWRAVQESGLPRRETLVWNAVPWFTGTSESGAAPTAGELRLGQTWLTPFLLLLPRLEVVVAFGPGAQSAATRLSTATPALAGRRFQVLLGPHPGQRVHAALAHAATALATRPDR